jgi:N utilization substance protein B
MASVNKLYELYIFFLILPLDLRHQALLKIEENRNKHLPTKEDLDPSLKFAENPVFAAIANSVQLNNYLKNHKVSWLNHQELVKKIFQEIRQSELYQKYMANPATDLEHHKKFVIDMFVNLVVNNAVVQGELEEENIYWSDDMDMAAAAVVKTLQSIKPDKLMELVPLWKNKEEDETFTRELFSKSILKRDQTDEWIKAKADNWEIERIASLDLILMNMAITEAIIFSDIPVKVTLNEYIDLAKEYSTPRSGIFVNGVLDKVFAALNANGTIKKSGRGLIG